MKLKTFLLNTSSHETMQMSNAHNDERVMREDPGFKANMETFITNRWKAVLRSANGNGRTAPAFTG